MGKQKLDPLTNWIDRRFRNGAVLRDALISPFQLIYSGLELPYLVPQMADDCIGVLVRIVSYSLFEGREPCH